MYSGRRFKYIEKRIDSNAGLPSSKKMLHPPPPRQLYDLTKDPQEKENLIESRPALARSMASAMHAAFARFDKNSQLTTPDIVHPVLLDRLRSLGFSK